MSKRLRTTITIIQYYLSHHSRKSSYGSKDRQSQSTKWPVVNREIDNSPYYTDGDILYNNNDNNNNYDYY